MSHLTEAVDWEGELGWDCGGVLRPMDNIWRGEREEI